MRDKRLDQLSAGFLQGWRAAEVSRIRLNQCRIEVVLADENAQPVQQFGLPVARTILVRRPYGLLFIGRRAGRSGKPAQLLDRAQADSVGLAQGSVDGPGFCHAHLSAADQGRCISRVGVTIADEAF